MEKYIGQIIVNLREEKGYTQNQLCRKLCSSAEMVNIERNQREPGYFLLDRLFGRLGQSTDRLEYVLSKEVYQIYNLRFQIQKEILYRNLKKAWQLLNRYESMRPLYMPLHTQFVLQELAQIAWITRKSRETVLEYVEKAIVQTMDAEPKFEMKYVLSGEELKLLLFRWEVSQGRKNARSFKELWKIMDYIEENILDKGELAQIYPYAVTLLGTYAQKIGSPDRIILLQMIENADELLRETGQLLYRKEIIELYIKILEETNSYEQKKKQLEQMLNALLEVEGQYGVNFEQYPLFCYMNRIFELDFDVIKQSRKACNISQEQLCEDICSQETLSRIENAKHAPSSKTLGLLLKKMNRERTRIGINVYTETYELLSLEKKIAIAEYQRDFEMKKIMLQKIRSKLDLLVIPNKQYVLSEQVYQDLREGLYTNMKGIQKLYEILHLTLEMGTESPGILSTEICDFPLTDRESNILNHIAMLYCEMQEKEKAIKIWKNILKCYNEKSIDKVFYLRRWELISGNLAETMKELDYVEEPKRLCLESIKCALEVGRGQEIGRLLSIVACIIKKEHNSKCNVSTSA